jgi:hypothetical protein
VGKPIWIKITLIKLADGFLGYSFVSQNISGLPNTKNTGLNIEGDL